MDKPIYIKRDVVSEITDSIQRSNFTCVGGLGGSGKSKIFESDSCFSANKIHLYINRKDFDAQHNLILPLLSYRLIQKILSLGKNKNAKLLYKYHEDVYSYASGTEEVSKIISRNFNWISFGIVIFFIILFHVVSDFGTPLLGLSNIQDAVVKMIVIIFGMYIFYIRYKNKNIIEEVFLSIKHLYPAYLVGDGFNYFRKSRGNYHKEEFDCDNVMKYLDKIGISDDSSVIIVIDINETPKDTESIVQLIRYVDKLISNSNNKIKVVFVSKRRRLLFDAADKCSNHINERIRKQIGVGELTIEESESLVTEMLNDFSGGTDRNLVLSEILSVRENKDENLCKKEVQLAQGIFDFLVSGPIGRQSRLAITVKERVEVFYRIYKDASLKELVLPDDVSNRLAIKNIIDEMAKQEYTDEDRFFYAIENKGQFKRSAKLLTYFKYIRKQDWEILSPVTNNLASFVDIKNMHSIFISKVYSGGITETIKVRAEVRNVLLRRAFINNEFGRDIKRLMLDNFSLLSNLDKSKYNDSLCISLLFCIESMTYIANFKMIRTTEDVSILKSLLIKINEVLENCRTKSDYNIDIMDDIYLSVFSLLESMVCPKYESEDILIYHSDKLLWSDVIDEFRAILDKFKSYGNIFILSNENKGALHNIEFMIPAVSTDVELSPSYILLEETVNALNSKVSKWEEMSFLVAKSREDSSEELDNNLAHELMTAFENRPVDYDELENDLAIFEGMLVSYLKNNNNEEARLEALITYRKYANSFISQIIHYRGFDQTHCQIVIRNTILSVCRLFDSECLVANRVAIDWLMLRFLSYSKGFLLESDKTIEEYWSNCISNMFNICKFLNEEQRIKLFECVGYVLEHNSLLERDSVLNLIVSLDGSEDYDCVGILINQLFSFYRNKNTAFQFVSLIIDYVEYSMNSENLVYSRVSNLTRVMYLVVAITLNNDDAYQSKLRRLYLKLVVINLSFKEIKWENTDYNFILNSDSAHEFYDMDFDGNSNSFFSSILEVLAEFSPLKSNYECGDFAFLKLKSRNDKFALFSSERTSEDSVWVSNELLSSRLFYILNLNNSKDIPFSLTQPLVIKNTISSCGSPTGTLRGPDYVSAVLQLFFPIANSWNGIGTSYSTQAKDGRVKREWIGNLWAGGSNSWVVIRVTNLNMTYMLANKGVFTKSLEFVTGIRRLTLFEKSSYSKEIASNQEIKHFVNNAKEKFVINYGLNDEVILTHTELVHDDRENRTFISMFRKIFDNPVSIYGWDNNALLSDDSELEEGM
ncbi:hypothetical protein ACVBIO_06155 [Shewanella sp. 0m-8]